MELKCDIQMDDLMVGLRHLMTTSPAVKAQIRKAQIIMVLLMVALLGVLGTLITPVRDPRIWGLFAGYCVVFALIQPALRRRAIIRQSRKMYEQSGARIFGPRTLSIMDRGLHSVSQFEEKTLFWDSITDIAMRSDRCIICVGDLSAFAIPKERVLAGDFDDFTRELTAQWQATRFRSTSV